MSHNVDTAHHTAVAASILLCAYSMATPYWKAMLESYAGEHLVADIFVILAAILPLTSCYQGMPHEVLDRPGHRV